MHDKEPGLGTSQQTVTPQQELQKALHTWLTKLHSRLRFLSQIEDSNSFANLISSLEKLQPQASEQQEASEQLKVNKKNSIELLLALDDFITKEKNLSLSIQFFIEKILKNCRFLIDNYRDTYAKYISLEETINQSNLTEDPKHLQIKLLDLNKEKKQLQKSPDFELTRITELTNDLEKFKLEQDRNFAHEIAMHEAKLKSFTQEFDKINEQAVMIEEELTFPIDQLEANLRIKQRKILHLEVDLYTLKQIHLDDIIKKLSSHLELENTRLKLLSELEGCDPIKILKTQIEHPKIKQEDLRTERKIKIDLTQNAQSLNVITEFLKDIIQLVPIKNNNIFNRFLEKISSILDLNSNKNGLEVKQVKTNEESTTPQEELIAFLQLNDAELIEHLKELAEEKQVEIAKLQFEKQRLEIVSKKNILNYQINELEEKIQTTKTDQHIFSILEDNNFLKPLIHLERLQKIADNTIHETVELQKQITEVEKQITDLKREGDKKDVAIVDSKLNKEKIKSREKIKILEKKKNKYILNLNAQFKDHNFQLQVEKAYRDQIQKEIKLLSEIKNREYLSKLAQNRRALRFNAIDRRLLIEEIENREINATREKEWKKIKHILNRTEVQLLENIIETSQNNNAQENIFFDSLKLQLINLKDQVEDTVWNKSGWGFFFKKVPDGIQKIRKIFNTIPFNISDLETTVEPNNLIMLSFFSEIYSLINQKNSSTKYLRSSAVKNFYQSLQEPLTQVNIQFSALNKPIVEMDKTTQPTCSTFPYSALIIN